MSTIKLGGFDEAGAAESGKVYIELDLFSHQLAASLTFLELIPSLKRFTPPEHPAGADDESALSQSVEDVFRFLAAELMPNLLRYYRLALPLRRSQQGQLFGMSLSI